MIQMKSVKNHDRNQISSFLRTQIINCLSMFIPNTLKVIDYFDKQGTVK